MGRNTAHRKAMLRNMADSLIIHGRIKTTLLRAKQLRRVADRLVTLGKDGSIAARRRATALLFSDEALQKLFGDLATHFKSRNGGYTRILRLGNHRAGDNALMALIEYVDAPLALRGKKAKEKDEKKKEKSAKGKDSGEKAEAKSHAKAEKSEAKAEGKTKKTAKKKDKE
jgi:large subunit ribosomal protein L17